VKPILLDSNQPELFYRGGDSIADFRGVPLEDAYRPEDWIASTTCLFGSDVGLTRLPDGQSLADAVADDPVAFLGEQHLARYGPDTALLVKLLDAGERLPVHLHPDATFAASHLGNAHGKTEAWVVLSTSVPHPEVYLGFRDELTAADVRELVRRQVPGELLAQLNCLPVAAGETFFVPAGIPHSIGPGVCIVEVQEPTDFSIMMEYRRYGIDGEKRGNLGLGFDTALEALDRSAWSAERLEASHGPNWLDSPNGVRPVLPSSADPFFRVETINSGGSSVAIDAGFSVLVVTSGSGFLRSGAADTTPLAAGQTVLLPHSAGECEVSGDVMLLRCRPAAVDHVVPAAKD
jgi:mannose-6-phosphate isomerase